MTRNYNDNGIMTYCPGCRQHCENWTGCGCLYDEDLPRAEEDIKQGFCPFYSAEIYNRENGIRDYDED